MAPLTTRWATYRVDGNALTGKGPYRATVRLIAQMVPANLVGAIYFAGFDYGMSAREVADNVVAGAEVLWEREVIFNIDGGGCGSEAPGVLPGGRHVRR